MTDPTAFYVGELNGEIISYIVAVKYPGHSAFLSTFAVAEEHRGKGYGRKIGDAAFNDLNKHMGERLAMLFSTISTSKMSP